MRSVTTFFLSRYLLRARREWIRMDTLFPFLGIMISVAVLITSFAIFDGYQNTLKERILGAFSHVYVFPDHAGGISHEEAGRMMRFLREQPEVLAIGPVINVQSMAAAGKRFQGVMLRGIDTSLKQQPTEFRKYVIEGTWELNSPNQSVIGYRLAKNLGVTIGDTIRLINPLETNFSLMGLRQGDHYLEVVGLYQAGMFEYDSRFVMTSMATVQEFAPHPDAYESLEIRLKPQWIDQAWRLADQWSLASESRIANVRFVSWLRFYRNLFELIELEKWILFIIMSFMVLIASFSVVSASATTLIDRRKQIGIMKAFGTPNRTLVSIFLSRIGIVCTTAVIAGELLGYLAGQFLTRQSLLTLKGDVYFLDRIYVRYEPETWLIVFAVATMISLISALIPLRRISRLDISEIIRGHQ